MPIINYNITYVGLILDGKKHDSAMLVDSGLLDELEQHAFQQQENQWLSMATRPVLCVFTSRYLTEAQELHHKWSYITKP